MAAIHGHDTRALVVLLTPTVSDTPARIAPCFENTIRALRNGTTDYTQETMKYSNHFSRL